jgi:O-antigen/teichoic acid export membrane protein
MKGSLAVIDQGLISAANFLLSILLARWLPANDYGAYAITFSVLVLLLLVYQALLLEPLAVFSGGPYRDCLRGYLKGILRLHLLIATPVTLGLGIVAICAYLLHADRAIVNAMSGGAVAAPCILLFWLARRAQYMDSSPAPAAGGAAIYCATVTGGVYLLYRLHRASPAAAFLLMGLGASAAAIGLLWALHKRLSADHGPAPDYAEVRSRHWQYGRWALATQTANWIPYYSFYPLISQFHGIGMAGELRALMNLSLPMEQSCSALSILFLSVAARAYLVSGPGLSLRTTVRISAVFVAATAVYWALVLPFRTSAVAWVYAGKYPQASLLLPWLAGGISLWALAFGPAVVLRSMQDPASVFYARATAAGTALACIPLIRTRGLSGVMVALVAGNAAALVVILLRLQVRISTKERRSLLSH